MTLRITPHASCPRAELVAAAALVAMTALGCGDVERCGVPGVVKACACADGRAGARVCHSDKTWRTCDCSGAIALPNSVSAGGGEGGATGGAGGSSGAGGVPGTSGTGGSTTPPPDDEDAGAEPMGGEGGASGRGGAGAGGSSGADAGPPDPLQAYRACSNATDCDPGATCTITPGLPTDSSVCAPACVDATECPVPEGDYEAAVECQTGRCRIDCTAVLFEPLLSCPADMECISVQLGQALCHAPP